MTLMLIGKGKAGINRTSVDAYIVDARCLRNGKVAISNGMSIYQGAYRCHMVKVPPDIHRFAGSPHNLKFKAK